ncbi:MAG TPA: hypothetical protein IAC82_10710 [Candidatus Merdivicinus intestinigallinarum]|nr:hypothetical protein [Candidatus Merdivicinus intestinigallinarum]
MNRKWIAVFCAMTMAISLVSCSSESGESASSEEPSTVSLAVSSSAEPSEAEGPSEASEPAETEGQEVAVNQILDFENGYFRVGYREDGADESKEGYMSIDGVVTTEEPKGLYENDGYTKITLYDENGQETYANDGEEKLAVIDAADGVYLVQEIRSGLDEAAWYAGIMDASGNWLDGPFNMTEMTGAQTAEAANQGGLGEGMLGIYAKQQNSNTLVVFDGETGACFSVNDVWQQDLQFRNGTMIYQQWGGGISGGQKGAICSLSKDGTVTELPVEGNLLCEGDNGFVTDANNLSFYDRSGQLLWSFDQYELAEDSEPIMYEEFICIQVIGADGNAYRGCLSQQTGELVYEPFQGGGYVCGQTSLTEKDGKAVFVDLLTGETNSEPDVDIDLSGMYDEIQYWQDGLYVIRHYEGKDASPKYKLYFFNAQGQEVIPTLKTE